MITVLKSTTARTGAAAAAACLALTLAACGSSSGSGSAGANNKMPTVTMMVGGIDKQIYLPYKLAQDLGYYHKYGVNMKLSTEQNGGVGAEQAMASGQVDMAGAWYVHAITFQQQGKPVLDVVQLSGSPGEREMCKNGSNVHSAAGFKGHNVGVTDLGSGTDDLTRYLAARNGLTTKDYHRIGVGAGSRFISALQHGKIVCGMTSQPTVATIEKKHLGYSAVDLASTTGTKKALGGTYPSASVLALTSWVKSHQKETQSVVDALVATMHYIGTHSAADIANHLPKKYTSNGTITKADYIAALKKDKGQFLPDALMPKNGPQTVLAVEKKAGRIHKKIDLSATYTNKFAKAAHALENN